MKGDKKIIEKLNVLLTDELTAIIQYIVQSEVCENWGFRKLHDSIQKQAMDEMKHAEKLISRIIFLEGMPAVGKLNQIGIGNTVEDQMKNDRGSEEGAVKEYNEGIRLCAESGDAGTADVLRSILSDEERHLDWLEAQLEQIKQTGIQNYLGKQGA